MGERVAVVFGDGYRLYKFSETHPLNPVRVELAVDLIDKYGLFLLPAVEHIPPRQAAPEELGKVHSEEYIKAVEAAGKGELTAVQAAEFGLGPGDNPIFPEMHEGAAWVAGGSLVSAELVLSGEFVHAFNPGGGLHHAQENKAAGFCVYNDAALACARLAEAGLKVAYIDVDAHHGDGVQWAFYDSPQVLTVSMHESGAYLFPGTGFIEEIGEGEGRGFSVNIPVPPGCYDEAYLNLFEKVVPKVVRAFAPDVVVSQNGCDGHFNDPLTHLGLTTNAYRRVFQEIHRLAHEICGGRLVALGGGGYDLYDAVPRIWTLLFANLANSEVSDSIPESWRAKCRAMGGGLCPTDLNDVRKFPHESIKSEVEAAVEATLEEIERTVFPFLESL